jgi:dCTP deaminase
MGRRQIQEAIRKGRIVIEPLLADFQIGLCSVDIRIGTRFELGPFGSQGTVQSSKIGDPVLVMPSTSARFVTLETIALAPDIAGLIFPRSVFVRLGALMIPTRIDPGWRGKLRLAITNLSGLPLKLVTGERVASVVFFQLQEKAERYYSKRKYVGLHEFPKKADLAIDKGTLVPTLEKSDQVFRRAYRLGEYERLTEVLSKKISNVQSETRPNIRQMLHLVLNEADSQKKGRLLEDLVLGVISTIKGLSVIRQRKRMKTGVPDFVVKNKVNSLFWKELGTPIVIECKNWKDDIGVNEINRVSLYMESISPNVKTAIIFCRKPLSRKTRQGHGAKTLIRDLRVNKGHYILVLSAQDLKRIGEGESAAKIIEEKYDELLVDEGL